ncbi:hypothetical protein BDV96DRAFT_655016 [Lophiotrema nucula]|uniref:Uncharacterized protein n=1 Tax=Lophiotrema nucula TaxID=690887 RepID=A0A6A5YGF1_9PLEO|nr:hypothetical protein BDV96DRAFT_655016 [Lophiotrema nucula]
MEWTKTSPVQLQPQLDRTTFHSWSRLPDELKLNILSHHLTAPDSVQIDRYLHRITTKRLLLPLIATRNRELATLARQVYYETNTFIIEPEVLELAVRRDATPDFVVLYPNRANTHWIRKMVLRHRMMSTGILAGLLTSGASLWQKSQWEHLLRPKRLSKSTNIAEMHQPIRDSNFRTRWQDSFTNLKRRHQDMVTPSTSATTSSSATLPSGASRSLRSTPSPPTKRPRTGADSCTSSPRVEYYCPFCHKTRKNDKQKHISTHLVERCSSLSPENHTNAGERSDSAYLFGCGFCGPAGETLKYYGEAHLHLEGLIRHVADMHSSRPSKLSWDINNVLNNVLTHKVFGGAYDTLRAQDYPHVTSMSWTSRPETEKLLYELEKLGGRLMDASGNVTPLDCDGVKTVGKLLAAATVPIQNTKSDLRTAPHLPHPPLASTGSFALGSQPNPFAAGPTSTATPDNPGLQPQAYAIRRLNSNAVSALTQGTNFNPPLIPPD